MALLLTIASSLLIARGIARPVQKLAAFARRIAAGHYDAPLEIKQNDEIRRTSIACTPRDAGSQSTTSAPATRRSPI